MADEAVPRPTQHRDVPAAVQVANWPDGDVVASPNIASLLISDGHSLPPVRPSHV